MIGTRIGMGFAIGGLGSLAGGPGAGAILSPFSDLSSLWIGRPCGSTEV